MKHFGAWSRSSRLFATTSRVHVIDTLDLPVIELRLHEIRKRDVRDRASRINGNHLA
jgi:hypothetical protein